MSRRPVILLFLLLCPGIVLAQLGKLVPKPAEAAATVREFCRLDYMGGRLSADGWKRMKPLTTWTDSSAWRTFRVVSRYDQTDENAGPHTAHIMVRYLPVGIFELGIGFTPSTDPDDVTFTVRENDGAWRIDTTEPEPLFPQVSKPAAVQWLQAKLKTVTDAAEKISIESALQKLQGK